MGVRWGSVRSPLGFLGSLGSPLGVLGTSRGPRVELEGLLVGLLVGVFGCFFGASSGLLGGLWVPVGALRGGSLVCIVHQTRRVATTMNEKESSLESRRQDTHHPRVGGFDGQTLTDICLEVDLKSYNKYLPASGSKVFFTQFNRCIFVCFPMFGPSSVAGAPSNMQKAIENMCFDNFGVWTK